MPSRSNVSIRLKSDGDVVLDQLVNAKENTSSPSFVFPQHFPGGVSTVVENPCSLLAVGEYAISGILIVPPRDNTYPYALSTLPAPPSLLYHPTNPMFITLISLGVPLYLYHDSPTPLVFTFFWI
jgi:hypothetical protein